MNATTSDTAMDTTTDVSTNEAETAVVVKTDPNPSAEDEHKPLSQKNPTMKDPIPSNESDHGPLEEKDSTSNTNTEPTQTLGEEKHQTNETLLSPQKPTETIPSNDQVTNPSIDANPAIGSVTPMETTNKSPVASALPVQPTINDYIGRRIARQFQVLSSSKVHQKTGGKVRKIFFGSVVAKLQVLDDAGGTTEKWKIFYDDGDVDIMTLEKLQYTLAYYDTVKRFDLRKVLRDQTESDTNKGITGGPDKNTPFAAKTPPKKAKKATISKSPRKEAVPVWVGFPDEKLDGGWPAGWEKRIFMRQGGATKGSKDRYWYTPKTKIKLRSMKEVKKFIRALPEAGGDEKKARTLMKNY